MINADEILLINEEQALKRKNIRAITESVLIQLNITPDDKKLCYFLNPDDGVKSNREALYRWIDKRYDNHIEFTYYDWSSAINHHLTEATCL